MSLSDAPEWETISSPVQKFVVTNENIQQGLLLKGRVGLALIASSEFNAAGGTVQFKLSVQNRSESDLKLWSDNGKLYDFVVREAGTPIWWWSCMRHFQLIRTSLELAAGETKELELSWTLDNNQREALAPGLYTVQGMLRASTVGPPDYTRIGERSIWQGLETEEQKIRIVKP